MPDPTPQPVSLLFGVHAHQPVGNFPAVIDDAVERCYRPFLKTLLRYPDFRFAAHFSGWLLGDLLERHPADMEMLAQMVHRGQVELFGAGDCEPVLASIPSRDRIAQLRAMSDRLERAFGPRPAGAWLTERVWESSVVPSLQAAGIRYVVVDDYHFLCTGREAGELDRHFTTEEDGRPLDVFPISEALRYRLPFAPAAESASWIAGLSAQRQAAAVYFDDIEKFGIWPETYEWVYGKGWLQQFIESVLSSPDIRTETFAQFHARVPARGVVYLPTTSYIEMNEWSLPARAAQGFNDLAQRERESGRFEASKAWVRGGIWRNFLSRYPEANWMHKRMLSASARLDSLGEAHPAYGPLRDSLHRAQSNDAYWHGLFGGLYLPHLRRAVWHELVGLEVALDDAGAPASAAAGDLDLDGRQEWLLRGEGLLAALRDDGHASVHEFDSGLLAHNFADTLARRAEAYHRRIVERPSQHHDAGEGIASAHDRLDFKHHITPADLEHDARPRTLFVDVLQWPDGRQQALDAYRPVPGEPGVFIHDVGNGAVTKRFRIADGCLQVEWQLRALDGARLCTRLNVSMPSCDGFGGRYRLSDGSIPCGFGQALELPSIHSLHLEDHELGGRLELGCEPAAALACAPYHTVSLSEAGFEKIMQAAVVDLQFVMEATDAVVRVRLAAGR